MLALALAAFTAAAAAQPQPNLSGGRPQLDPALTASTTIGSGDASDQRIERFVDAYADELLSEDRSAAAEAAEQLLLPLRFDVVSVPFRQRYAAAMRGVIDRLESSDLPRHHLAALRFAGEIAEESLLGVIERGLNADARQRQIFAVVAAEIVFEAVERSGQAVRGQRLVELSAAVADTGATGSRPDPDLADARVRTLLTAAEVDESRASGLRRAALTRAVETTAEFVAALPPDANEHALRAASRLARALRDGMVRGEIEDRQVVRAAAAFAGELVAHVEARILAGTLADAAGESVESIMAQFAQEVAQLAERQLVSDAQRRLNSGEPLGPLLRDPDNRRLRPAIRQFLQTLAEPGNPFGIQPGRYDL